MCVCVCAYSCNVLCIMYDFILFLYLLLVYCLHTYIHTFRLMYKHMFVCISCFMSTAFRFIYAFCLIFSFICIRWFLVPLNIVAVLVAATIVTVVVVVVCFVTRSIAKCEGYWHFTLYEHLPEPPSPPPTPQPFTLKCPHLKCHLNSFTLSLNVSLTSFIVAFMLRGFLGLLTSYGCVYCFI